MSYRMNQYNETNDGNEGTADGGGAWLCLTKL